MENNKGILLESGTNELEIIEFELQNSKFGINVIKVKEIIQPVPTTKIPHAHPIVEGIIQLRGEVLPVINLAKALDMEMGAEVDPAKEKFIVSQFNKQSVIFRVHNVTRIHRISWEQIEKPSQMYQGSAVQVVGVIKRNDEMVLLLDFEKILLDIDPESGIHTDRIKKLGKRERSEKRIVVAEDSPLLRKLLHDTLMEAGYVHTEFFENGKDAFTYLQKQAEQSDAAKLPDFIITDIEMPQMDGHHLTKKIKEHAILSSIPVVIFSSLITEDLKHKGEMVGAEGQVSKPEIEELVLLMDKLMK
ncbi:chemotaxis protein [Falsibacillus pallidus]|uniref:Two-component system chemotaxis response regulator CheV n=1 Tax=Falsibacillus pallidus TaxID=493781 RepID=A0A370GVU2_9BACI|nr:chemotaxis protein [Falsibacillus pallidus]RDI47651.1 two-component system chemotaxis response regulator CheV [Falsibacillus pallidus]